MAAEVTHGCTAPVGTLKTLLEGEVKACASMILAYGGKNIEQEHGVKNKQINKQKKNTYLQELCKWC